MAGTGGWDEAFKFAGNLRLLLMKSGGVQRMRLPNHLLGTSMAVQISGGAAHPSQAPGVPSSPSATGQSLQCRGQHRSVVPTEMTSAGPAVSSPVEALALEENAYQEVHPHLTIAKLQEEPPVVLSPALTLLQSQCAASKAYESRSHVKDSLQLIVETLKQEKFLQLTDIPKLLMKVRI